MNDLPRFLPAVERAAGLAGPDATVKAIDEPERSLVSGRAGRWANRGGGVVRKADAIQDQPALRDTAGTAFTGWTSELGTKLTQAGMGSPRATELASLMIAALEGAHILCRAARSIAPFDSAATALLAGAEGPG